MPYKMKVKDDNRVDSIAFFEDELKLAATLKSR